MSLTKIIINATIMHRRSTKSQVIRNFSETPEKVHHKVQVIRERKVMIKLYRFPGLISPRGAQGDFVQASSAVTITVTAPNSPPSVALTAPANNASFPAGTSITLTATASDSDGSITKVEFYNGATKLGEDASSPYSFTWPSVPAGTIRLQQRPQTIKTP